MRGFLIFLAVACPVVLAIPAFWSLVRMEWGAERVGYVDQAGVTQWATIGPKSQWPNWAMVPEGAQLKIGSRFEAAPGHGAGGFGELSGGAAPRLVAERYEAALRSAGWAVRVGRIDATYPEIPPRPLHWCIVQAQKGPRVQQMSVEIDRPRTVGRLHWSEGRLGFPIGTKDEPCWPDARS